MINKQPFVLVCLHRRPFVLVRYAAKQDLYAPQTTFRPLVCLVLSWTIYAPERPFALVSSTMPT